MLLIQPSHINKELTTDFAIFASNRLSALFPYSTCNSSTHCSTLVTESVHPYVKCSSPLLCPSTEDKPRRPIFCPACVETYFVFDQTSTSPCNKLTSQFCQNSSAAFWVFLSVANYREDFKRAFYRCIINKEDMTSQEISF